MLPLNRWLRGHVTPVYFSLFHFDFLGCPAENSKFKTLSHNFQTIGQIINTGHRCLTCLNSEDEMHLRKLQTWQFISHHPLHAGSSLSLPIRITLNKTGLRAHKYSSHFQVECYENFKKDLKIFNKEVTTFGITILQEHGERNYLWKTARKIKKKNKMEVLTWENNLPKIFRLKKKSVLKTHRHRQ